MRGRTFESALEESFHPTWIRIRPGTGLATQQLGDAGPGTNFIGMVMALFRLLCRLRQGIKILLLHGVLPRSATVEPSHTFKVFDPRATGLLKKLVASKVRLLEPARTAYVGTLSTFDNCDRSPHTPFATPRATE